jgi:hypothetical protein
MANYKELEGFGVQTLATDPDTPGWVGSIFYNSTEGVFKVVKPGGVTAGTWASGGNLNTARYYLGGQTSGTQTSGICVGGLTTVRVGNTELYNGTSWTETTDLNSGRLGSGVGAADNTSALVFGGQIESGPTDVNLTESWNGSTWTEVSDMANSKFGRGGFGTQTAAIASGGIPGPTIAVESWNGSAWTEVNDLNTARGNHGTCGVQTSGLANAADASSGETESWDGTSWTIITSYNTFRDAGRMHGTSNTSALNTAGTNAGLEVTNVEYWDGTSWTEIANTAKGGGVGGSAGSSSAALLYARGGAPQAATEEFTAPDLVINTLTTS